MSSAGICASLLAAVPGLDGRALKDLEALAAEAEQIELRRGEILVRQGDPSDVLYFVLSGRFAVRFEGAPDRSVEIPQGQPIGEIGFFANLPRTATLVALRDSRVLAISRAQFELMNESSPVLRDAVLASLATRLSKSMVPAATTPAPMRTVAVMAAGDNRVPHRFIAALQNTSSGRHRVIFLTSSEVAARLGNTFLDDPSCSSWLNSLEAEAELIFYIADDTLNDWTRKCIRQADGLLLVGEAGAPTELNASETFAFALHPHTARRLVILHEQRTTIASGTGSWLQSRDVFMHHHVALQDVADVQRLLRFMFGRAVGFVAGGGGALGSAHLGVHKAFCEAGADFDILGGTSSGAAMAAALAYGVEPERIDAGTHNIFVRSRVFRRLTLPRYGLIDHKAFDRALQAEFGDVMIEDIWKPFFAVSTDLSDHRPHIHRRGLVWHALRASGSIPGVLPPFFTKEGQMLVDGALMDNVPLVPMKALKGGPNVVVVLSSEAPTRYHIDYDKIPGPRDLAVALLNPFARQQLPHAPTILQVIMLSMLANRRLDLPLSHIDILIKPELPDNFGFMSWSRHSEAFLHAYRETAAWIQNRNEEKEVQLKAVIGAL